MVALIPHANLGEVAVIMALVSVSEVFTIAYLLIASFAVAVTRAWALMQGRTTRHVSAK